MRSKGDVTTGRTTMGVLILGLLVAAGGVASAAKPAHVAPPQSHPHGQTYSEWAADWWVWALSEPTPTNPLMDPTGAQCASGQTGNVWFLAGSFDAGNTTRSCSIPTGKALVFPMLNNFTCAFLNNPPENRTEEFLRAQVAGTAAGAFLASESTASRFRTRAASSRSRRCSMSSSPPTTSSDSRPTWCPSCFSPRAWTRASTCS